MAVDRDVELESLIGVLRAEIELLRAENGGLRGQVTVLAAKVEVLERDASRHSGNSGRPPSADTMADKAAQAEAVKSRAERRRDARKNLKKLMASGVKRNPGKQPGGKGFRLVPVTEADFVNEVVASCCGGCGGGLIDAEVVGVESRQVFDLPERRALEVTEHRGVSLKCGCGHVTKPVFPPEAAASAVYGPLLRAVATYLLCRQHVPVARCAELLADVLGAPVSTGWLAGLSVEASGGLDGFIAELKQRLAAENVLHADETSAKVGGARWWFHVTCTDLITLLSVHPKRGTAAFDAIGVLPNASGVLVSDGWKPYWSYPALEHALCCAHLLRDLVAVGEIGGQTGWTDAMARLLVDAKNAVDDVAAAGGTALPAGTLASLRRRYTTILNNAKAHNPEIVGRKRSVIEAEPRNLIRRFDNQRHEICRHWTDFEVSFDNNVAERGLRMIKLQQKINGGWRTEQGAEAFSNVRSYLQTAAKHGVDLLDVLVDLFTGNPWTPTPAAAGP